MLGMLALFCAMSCVFVLSALVPTYLVSYLKLSADQMAIVTSALGFGGFFGQFGVPGFRTCSGAGSSRSSVSSARRRHCGCSRTRERILPALFAGLFVVSFFCLGNVALITGPIATEAAPAGLISSAIGVVVGTGEIFGGGIAPSIAGYVANHYGIENTLYVALTGVTLGVVVSVLFKETAPRKTALAANRA